jgi:hypothetical protein
MKKKPSNRTIQKLNQKIDRLKQMETNLNSRLSKQYIGISVQKKKKYKIFNKINPFLLIKIFFEEEITLFFTIMANKFKK